MEPSKVKSLQRSVSGQKQCRGCMKSFNNRSLPEFCDNCNYRIGGQFVPKDKKNTDPQLLTSTLASVRTNKAGIPTRTFVDLSKNKVYTIVLYRQ